MQKNGEQRIQSVPLAAFEDARNAALDAQKGTAVAVALSDFLASTYVLYHSLLESHETCSREARSVLRTAEKFNDPVTGDLMLRRMAFHDKAAWQLRALIS